MHISLEVIVLALKVRTTQLLLNYRTTTTQLRVGYTNARLHS